METKSAVVAIPEQIPMKPQDKQDPTDHLAKRSSYSWRNILVGLLLGLVIGAALAVGVLYAVEDSSANEPSNLKDACKSNLLDAEILAQGSAAREDIKQFFLDIGNDCGNNEQCRLNAVVEKTELGGDCTTCFAQQTTCIIENCPVDTTFVSFSSCWDDFCAVSFEECTGIDFDNSDVRNACISNPQDAYAITSYALSADPNLSGLFRQETDCKLKGSCIRDYATEVEDSPFPVEIQRELEPRLVSEECAVCVVINYFCLMENCFETFDSENELVLCNAEACAPSFQECSGIDLDHSSKENTCRSNEADASILVTASYSLEDVIQTLSKTGTKSSEDLESSGFFIYTQIAKKFGVSAECTTCFFLQLQCSVEKCSSQCSGDPLSESCVACNAQFCVSSLEQCTGFEFNSVPENPNPSCTSESDAAVFVPGSDAVKSLNELIVITSLVCFQSYPCLLEEFKNSLGVSEDCASCFVDISSCYSTNCALVCIRDPDDAECTSCVEEFCFASLGRCTGIALFFGNNTDLVLED